MFSVDNMRSTKLNIEYTNTHTLTSRKIASNRFVNRVIHFSDDTYNYSHLPNSINILLNYVCLCLLDFFPLRNVDNLSNRVGCWQVETFRCCNLLLI